MSTFPDVPHGAAVDHEVLVVAGSRSEVARLAPVSKAIAKVGRMRAVTVAAGAEPITVLDAFESLGVDAQVTLLPNGPLLTTAAEAASLATRMDELLAERVPDAVLVSGGGTTALIAAQVAFWRKVPVVHLQSGAAGDDLLCSFPQEANRRVISQLASLFLLTAGTAGLGSPIGPNAIVIGDPLDAGSVPADPTLARAVRQSSVARPLVTVAIAGDPRLSRLAAALPGALDGVEIVAVPSDLEFSELLALLSASSLLITDDLSLDRDATASGALTLLVGARPECIDAASASVSPEPHRVVRVARQMLDRAARRPADARDDRAAERAEQAMGWMFGLQPSPSEPPGVTRSSVEKASDG